MTTILEQTNAAKGRAFHEAARSVLASRLGVELRADVSISIGNPPKPHKFDLASTTNEWVGECKNFSWTRSGNTPSAKLSTVNEAVLYLSFLPPSTSRFLVLAEARTANRGESLAEYYVRNYGHLLQGIQVFEVNTEANTLREVS